MRASLCSAFSALVTIHCSRLSRNATSSETGIGTCSPCFNFWHRGRIAHYDSTHLLVQCHDCCGKEHQEVLLVRRRAGLCVAVSAALTSGERWPRTSNGRNFLSAGIFWIPWAS